ncbi:hypothetical protein DFR30_0219 [Thiogranum longum]|uniref:Uncharacterized protein n=1 Tax=Thiogranum longum TaxID=1537524 RepID=A0A4R1HCQ1_9GAMM|nr:hypothetical protein [Thiogranum longum]TCK16999.1 hypothetical protein DFR30_0219 [Thiogranum longum]
MRLFRLNGLLAVCRSWTISSWGLALCLMAAAAPAADDAQGEDLSQAFLEFLGEWEDEKGDWQDPLEYETPVDAPAVPEPKLNVEQSDETH